jgi:hypothetical protein
VSQGILREFLVIQVRKRRKINHSQHSIATGKRIPAYEFLPDVGGHEERHDKGSRLYKTPNATKDPEKGSVKNGAKLREDVGDLIALRPRKIPLNFQALFSSLAKACLRCLEGTMQS